ncbi:MAG: F0F1 ATP synthase subunit A [Saprospiraceae bacterium]|nr:F0F1 ATP synthase subunit A [Saprospiraceae bacterium]
MKQIIILFIVVFVGSGRIFSQESTSGANNSIVQEHSHEGHNHDDHAGHSHNNVTPASPQETAPHAAAHASTEDHKFDPKSTAFHHISDLNVYSIGPWNFPLPCILYSPDNGWSCFSSGKFHIDNAHHGSGHKVIDRYVLNHGRVNRIADPSLPSGALEIQTIISKKVTVGGKEKEQDFAIINGIEYALDKSSTADGGLFGGGLTSFYDFSITKNVFSMLFVFLLLSWVFLSMAKNYKKAPGTAPKGAQLLMEPLVIFIQEEVAKPFLGPKWERFLPMLLSIFFFVLGLNLFGQIPFLGGSNVTGNLSFTMVLALIAFIVVNFNGNKHYWEHIFWMPGIPAWVKIILTPVEVLGVLIKPLTLMLRLFANITAGHMAILIFISLIFIFGNSGASTAAGLGASIGSGLLTVFMMSIELLVAMIQAFVFTLLTASYIGAATEEHHHAEH